MGTPKGRGIQSHQIIIIINGPYRWFRRWFGRRFGLAVTRAVQRDLVASESDGRAHRHRCQVSQRFKVGHAVLSVGSIGRCSFPLCPMCLLAFSRFFFFFFLGGSNLAMALQSALTQSTAGWPALRRPVRARAPLPSTRWTGRRRRRARTRTSTLKKKMKKKKGVEEAGTPCMHNAGFPAFNPRV